MFSQDVSNVLLKSKVPKILVINKSELLYTIPHHMGDLES